MLNYNNTTTIQEIREEIKNKSFNWKEFDKRRADTSSKITIVLYLITREDKTACNSLKTHLHSGWENGNDNGTLNSSLINAVYGDRSKASVEGKGRLEDKERLFPKESDMTLEAYWQQLDKAEIKWGRNIQPAEDQCQKANELKRKILEEIIPGKQITLYNADDKDIDNTIKQYGNNIVLYGPPGTGKTREAKIRAAKWITGDEEMTASEALKLANAIMQKEENEQYRQHYGQLQLVQFHPSYSYNDFMETIDITKKGYTDRIFKEFAKKAAEDGEKKPYVLIVDEINRANVSEVLGELLYGLEYREKEFTTGVSNSQFSVPDNLYIIGTMNTADKSLQTLDYAVRRRFAFEKIESKKPTPESNASGNSSSFYEIESNNNKQMFFLDSIFELVKKDVEDSVARGIMAEDIMPGVSYFIIEGSDDKYNEEHLQYKIKYELIPLLKEYIKDGMFTNRKKIQKGKSLIELIHSGDYENRLSDAIKSK